MLNPSDPKGLEPKNSPNTAVLNLQNTALKNPCDTNGSQPKTPQNTAIETPQGTIETNPSGTNGLSPKTPRNSIAPEIVELPAGKSPGNNQIPVHNSDLAEILPSEHGCIVTWDYDYFLIAKLFA